MVKKTLILFDYNNLACRCAHLQQVSDTEKGWSFMSYMIFNSMYDFVQDVAEALGVEETLDVVLALDSKDGYWRRDIYSPYKADRTVKRSQDGVNWERAYREFDKLSEAIAKYTPWKVLRVSKCEADDIIYTLAYNFGADKTSNQRVIIHSGDSDYLQLLRENVFLYMPHLKQYAEIPGVCRISGKDVYCKSSEEYLQYAILTGQGGKDNVYNVKTPTDWVCTAGKRKPGLGIVAAQKLIQAPCGLEQSLQQFGLWENYQRNKQLIDMRALPDNYFQTIWQEYKACEEHSADIQGLLSVYDWPSLYADADCLSAQMDFWAGRLSPVDVVKNGITTEFQSGSEEVIEFVL